MVLFETTVFAKQPYLGILYACKLSKYTVNIFNSPVCGASVFCLVFILLLVLWISEEEGRRHRIAFNSLYLFSCRSIIYEANGEELYNFTRGATLSWISQYAAGSFCLFSPPTRDSHPGGVATMTRDKGYPDWLC